MSGLRSKKYPWWRGLRVLAVGWTVLPLLVLFVLSVGAAMIALQATVKYLAENQNRIQTGLAADQLSGQLEQYSQAFRVLASQPGLTDLDFDRIEMGV